MASTPASAAHKVVPSDNSSSVEGAFSVARVSAAHGSLASSLPPGLGSAPTTPKASLKQPLTPGGARGVAGGGGELDNLGVSQTPGGQRGAGIVGRSESRMGKFAEAQEVAKTLGAQAAQDKARRIAQQQKQKREASEPAPEEVLGELERNVEVLRARLDRLVRANESKVSDLARSQDKLNDVETSLSGMADLTSEISMASISTASGDLTAPVALSIGESAFDFDDTAFNLPAGATPAEKEAHIRELFNKLEKAGWKLRESAAINNTYKQMLTRIERQCLDMPQNAAWLESELARVSNESLKADQDMHRATHMRDQAKRDIAVINTAILEGRVEWTALIQGRKDKLQEVKQMNADAAKRHKRSQLLLAKATGDMTKKDELVAKSKHIARHLERSKSGHDKVGAAQELMRMEEMFHKIRMMTGEEDLDAIVDGIINTGSLTDRLNNSVSRLSKEVKDRKSKLAQAENDFMDLRLMGDSFAMARQQVDVVDEKLDETMRENVSAKFNFEKKQTILVQAKIGMEGTLERIDAVSNKKSAFTEGNPPPESAQSVEVLLKLMESRLGSLTDVLNSAKGVESAAPAAAHTDANADEDLPTSAPVEEVEGAGGAGGVEDTKDTSPSSVPTQNIVINPYSPTRRWGVLDRNDLLNEHDEDSDDSGTDEDESYEQPLSRKVVKGSG